MIIDHRSLTVIQSRTSDIKTLHANQPNTDRLIAVSVLRAKNYQNKRVLSLSKLLQK